MHPLLTHLIALEHSRDMLAQADRDRPARSAAATGGQSLGLTVHQLIHGRFL